QKFCNHLPLYRQQSIFERDGLRLSRKTQCDWALASAGLLEPIVECKFRQIRAGPPRTVGPGKPVLQLDDTPVMCQGGRGVVGGHDPRDSGGQSGGDDPRSRQRTVRPVVTVA
ncbi:MAG: transposase, partial [Planctomycetes bacterium]|nr:transposase [Planctomycetota bacterium]